MKLMEKTNTVYLIRKSFIDESTEFARCSNLELAVSICKPGYSIFDEEGNLLHTTVVEGASKFGKNWDTLKTKIEKLILYTNNNYSRFPMVTLINSIKDADNILNSLMEILQLMNKIEVEESKNE